MNVLSLFDGMSCGQIALNRVGIKPSKYYAAELDKHAIAVTLDNYPDTVQLGDVTKWYEWDVDWASIDLLIGGSPCQGFSFAGKQLAFDDPRSKLFFVYLDILSYIKLLNPGVKFLLENVKMKKQHLDVISDALDVQPMLINSALVSAQNRQRYYWCNWRVSQPADRGLLIEDIRHLDSVDERFYLSDKILAGFKRKRERRAGMGSGFDTQNTRSATDKASCLTARYHKTSMSDTSLRCGGRLRRLTPVECERLQTVPDDYTAAASNTQRYRMLGNGWTVDVIAHIFKEGLL